MGSCPPSLPQDPARVERACRAGGPGDCNKGRQTSLALPPALWTWLRMELWCVRRRSGEICSMSFRKDCNHRVSLRGWGDRPWRVPPLGPQALGLSEARHGGPWYGASLLPVAPLWVSGPRGAPGAGQAGSRLTTGPPELLTQGWFGPTGQSGQPVTTPPSRHCPSASASPRPPPPVG